MHNVPVYHEAGLFAGWPANHGAWQWGDELLVGFLRGPYDKSGSMHRIAEPLELVQARSLDAGRTWRFEQTGIPLKLDDEAMRGRCEDLDLDHAIIKVRGVYDTGGDYVRPMGGFFVSVDRGATWGEPYAFLGLSRMFADPYQCTARTRTLGNLVFLSRADRNMWGTDSVFCARQWDGRFEFVGTVCDDTARAVMPAVAKIGDRIVCALRRRSSQRLGGWIDAFGSDDEGKTWRFLAEVGRTGRNNGNPPALIAAGDRFVCVYGDRDEGAIIARHSRDGVAWSLPTELRSGGKTDIGYPQLFGRSDGGLVAVYYWAAKGEREEQHIEATHFTVDELA